MAKIPIQGEFEANGTFPLLDDGEQRGGFRIVTDIAARDAIPAERRKQGMLVGVQSDGKLYVLSSDLTTWVEFVSGGAGGTPVPGTIYVDATSGSDGNDGLTPATAVQTFQAALDRRRLRIKLLTDVTVTTNLIFPGGGSTRIQVYSDLVDQAGPLTSAAGSTNFKLTNSSWTFTPSQFKGMFVALEDGTYSPINDNDATNIFIQRGIGSVGVNFAIVDMGAKLQMAADFNVIAGVAPGILLAGIALKYIIPFGIFDGVAVDMVLGRLELGNAALILQNGAFVRTGFTAEAINDDLFPGDAQESGFYVQGVADLNVQDTGSSLAFNDTTSEATNYLIENGGSATFENCLLKERTLQLIGNASCRLLDSILLHHIIVVNSGSFLEVNGLQMQDPNITPAIAVDVFGKISLVTFGGTNGNSLATIVQLSHASSLVVGGTPTLTGTTNDILIGSISSSWAALTETFDTSTGCYAAKLS